MRLHRGLVLGQLAAVSTSVWLMAQIGFAAWTLASLGVAVALMLASMGVQSWWSIRDGRESRPARKEESLRDRTRSLDAASSGASELSHFVTHS